MIELIWNFMQPETLSQSASWIMQNIFLNWTNGLLNWYQSANYTWSAVIIFIVVVICLLELWVLGLVFAYCGPWAWIVVIWLICWLFYLFAIPALGGMYFAHQIIKPGRLHKIKTLLLLIVFVFGISLFPNGLSPWYGIAFLIYLFLILDLITPNHKSVFV